MCSQENQKWANSTKQELESIAQNWAKKYNTKLLRTFQDAYMSWLGNLSTPTELELKGELTDTSYSHMALNNRLIAIARAIDIREFGKDKI